MEAHCRNEDCKHDWTLQKHPDEYKRGVTCPDCGSTRVDVDGADERSGADAPARREEQSRGRGRERTPARRRDAGRGLSGAESAIALLDDETDTRTKAQAGMQVLEFGKDLLDKFSTYQEQKEEARKKRVEKVELEKERNLPECTECGHTFTEDDIGLGDERVSCPECGEVFRVKMTDGPVDIE